METPLTLLQRYKYDKMPISKKILWGKKCFVLFANKDIPKQKIKKGDLLLFEFRKPKHGEISLINTTPNTFKMGKYRVAKDGQQGLVSLITGDLLVVLAPGENFISGVLVENLGNPNGVA